jgi:hypothetical protein
VTAHTTSTVVRQQAQRRNSLKSPWRKGPACATKRAIDEWSRIKDQRERELNDE